MIPSLNSRSSTPYESRLFGWRVHLTDLTDLTDLPCLSRLPCLPCLPQLFISPYLGVLSLDKDHVTP